MQHRGLTSALAVLTATIGLSALAGGAQAAVVDNDGILLSSSTEVQLTGANVAFDFTNGTVTPHLTGTLQGSNADDLCVRVRIDSYDGATLLHSKPGKK